MRLSSMTLAPCVVVVVALAAAGCPGGEDACAVDADCDAAVCVDGVCEAVDVCSLDELCPDGFTCQANGQANGTGAVCRPIVGIQPAGNACAVDDDCDTGACAGDVCVATCTLDDGCGGALLCVLDGPRRVCVDAADVRADGAACADPRECLSGTCVRVPPEEQAVCAPACDAAHACADPAAFCAPLAAADDDVSGGARACVVPAADGALCVDDAFCAGGRCLDDDGVAVCASACVDDACAAGFVCVDDDAGAPVCLPERNRFDDGAACDDARDCASHICGRYVATGLDVTLCASPCPAEGCGPDEICWVADGDAPDLCGPVPPA